MARPDKARKERIAKLERWLLYALGLIGWLLVIKNAPFGWSVPNYALF
jgi:hypothetical protein